MVASTGGKLTGIDPEAESMTFVGHYYDEKSNKISGNMVKVLGVPTDDIIIKLNTMVAAGIPVRCELEDGTAISCSLSTAILNSNGKYEKSGHWVSADGEILKDIALDAIGIAFEGVYYDTESGVKYAGGMSFDSNIPDDEVVIVLKQSDTVDNGFLASVVILNDIPKMSETGVFNYMVRGLSYTNPDSNQEIFLESDQYELIPTNLDNPNLVLGFNIVLNLENIPKDLIDPEAVYKFQYEVIGEFDFSGAGEYYRYDELLITKTIVLNPEKQVDTNLEIIIPIP